MVKSAKIITKVDRSGLKGYFSIVIGPREISDFLDFCTLSTEVSGLYFALWPSLLCELKVMGRAGYEKDFPWQWNRYEFFGTSVCLNLIPESEKVISADLSLPKPDLEICWNRYVLFMEFILIFIIITIAVVACPTIRIFQRIGYTDAIPPTFYPLSAIITRRNGLFFGDG